VDHTLAHLYEVAVPGRITATYALPPVVADEAPDFVKRVTALMLANKGDLLPVSAFPVDGTWPVGTPSGKSATSRWRYPSGTRSCAFSATSARWRARTRRSGESLRTRARRGRAGDVQVCDYKGADFKGFKYSLQVAPEDCTGCNLCVMVCPAKDKANPKHKAIDMYRSRRCARPSA